jgi:hypothetical protein
VRIRVRRMGGIAGNIALAAELQTADLGGLPWGAPAPEPPYPDAFRYEIDLPDEPQRGTAVLGEAEMERGMEMLRVSLKRDGVVEPGRRPG